MAGDVTPSASDAGGAGFELVQQFFCELVLPTWSAYSLRDMHGGWVSHASEESDQSTVGQAQLASLTLSYFEPTDRRQLLVRSEAVQPSRAPLSLGALTEWVSRGDLDEEPAAEWPSAGTVVAQEQVETVLIDSRPTPASGHRVGDAGAIRCRVDGVWVTVLFRNVQIDPPLAIESLSNLRPAQAQREVIVRALLSGQGD